MSVFRGPVQEFIEKKILDALKPTFFQVTNESHGRIEDESHFHVVVVSDDFNGLSLIKRHRLVNGLFSDETNNLKFHSLRLTTKTPEQWAKGSEISKAPKCTGKGDGRNPTDVNKLEG
eukprot:snap_masked-scaffold_7-processed-gene-9.23-mRNA-1 protein AED:0.06 eAED:0.06 QI:0/-1/0/1/-1/1/1/0/117